jgi:hypothetical protein
VGTYFAAMRVMSELLIRFVVGGVVVSGFALLGGLFLAFPGIFPASVTLVERHERNKRRQKGLHGERRGRLGGLVARCLVYSFPALSVRKVIE